jgi:hypothetical protein
MSIVNVVPGNTYQVIVGAGGQGGQDGSNFSSSNFINIGGCGGTGQTGATCGSSSFSNIIAAGGIGGIGGTGQCGFYVSACGYCQIRGGTNGQNGTDGLIENYIYPYNSFISMRSYIPTGYLPNYPTPKALGGQPRLNGEDGLVLIFY